MTVKKSQIKPHFSIKSALVCFNAKNKLKMGDKKNISICTQTYKQMNVATPRFKGNNLHAATNTVTLAHHHRQHITRQNNTLGHSNNNYNNNCKQLLLHQSLENIKTKRCNKMKQNDLFKYVVRCCEAVRKISFIFCIE